MDPNIMFVAGRIAGERGWTDATLVTVGQLPSLEPNGVPLVLVAESREIDALTARLVSSLDYVARPIMVILDKPLGSQAAKWVNPEIVRTVETDDVPKLVPTDTKTKEDLSAHEKREKARLEELKKVQPTPTLVPDQPKSDKSGSDDKSKDPSAKSKDSGAEGKSDKSRATAKSSKPDDSGKAAASGAKATAAKDQKSPPPPKGGKASATAGGSAKSSGGSKGSASAEAMREFRSLASD